MSSIDEQRQLRAAFETGLIQKFEEPVGRLLAAAVSYMPREQLANDRLKELVERDSAVVLTAILQGTVSVTTMPQIQAAMIGSALLHDRESVLRWAKEGATRAPRLGGAWPHSVREWEWVQARPDRYILLVRELKEFLNQV
jgi:hypothetical protein